MKRALRGCADKPSDSERADDPDHFAGAGANLRCLALLDEVIVDG
jgi:hypothetical protein